LFETRLQELEKFARGSDAYKELHVQYGRRVEEVHEMTTKCLSLHKELEEPQNKISNYESTQRSVAAEKGELEDRVKDLETKGAERAQKIQIVLDRETWARNRIEELEKEVNKRVARECLALQKVDEMEKERGQLSLALQKVDQLEKERGQVIQEYRAEINRRMACESLAEQRIDELQKRVEELMQGQAAMSITVDHMDPAEQNVGEFGEKCGTSEPPKMVSIGPSPPPERSPSLRAVKRGRSV
jgi:chromosome segregation ATPase